MGTNIYAYDKPLDPYRKFSLYGMEQQASIVADYYYCREYWGKKFGEDDICNVSLFEHVIYEN